MKFKCVAAVLAAFAALSVARADVITTIVPFPPGGPLDSVARVVSPALQEAGSDTYVIDNRSGANGMIGARLAAQAAADGRTWLYADGALLTVNPKLYPKDASFDPFRDLRVVAGLAQQPSILVVNAKSPWHTLQEFVAHGRAHRIMYASGGNGSTGHLTMEQFGSVAGLQLTHVPYKGGAPAMTDLLGGQVDAAFVSVAGAIGFVKSGKLRALAVSSPARVSALPDVPTAREAGVDFQTQGIYFVFLPAKTSDAVASEVQARLLRVMARKDVQDRLRALGLEPRPMPAQESREWIAHESEAMARLIAAKGIRAN